MTIVLAKRPLMQAQPTLAVASLDPIEHMCLALGAMHASLRIGLHKWPLIRIADSLATRLWP